MSDPVDNSVAVILADGTEITIIITPDVVRELAGAELDAVTGEYHHIDPTRDPSRARKLSSTDYVKVRASGKVWPVDKYIWEGASKVVQRRVAPAKSKDVMVEDSRDDPISGGVTLLGHVEPPSISKDDLFSEVSGGMEPRPPKIGGDFETNKNAFKRHARAGHDALAAGDFVGALREFDLALDLRPKNARIFLGLGRTFFGVHRFKECLDACARAREFASGDAAIIRACQELEEKVGSF